MNEWEFTSEIAGWINTHLEKNSRLPFSKASCEQQAKGSRKRRDLTLLDKHGKALLTGEVKLPYQKDGGSPLNSAVVRDARAKAMKAKADYFFTWNVNLFVLWEVRPSAVELTDTQHYKIWEVTNIHSDSQLELSITLDAIMVFLPKFLDEFAQVLAGASPLGAKSPDERFVEALEAALQQPILNTIVALKKLYEKPHFRRDLDLWMRDDLGWPIYTDPEGVHDNLERASQFACYALVNRLVFHEALLKRYGKQLQKITVPDHLDTGESLRLHLSGFFGNAKTVTGDYETVFGEDHSEIGNRVPFYSDSAVTYWRDLINEIHEFDFSKLDYEIIGGIFEKLIDPEERKKFGQFYTRVEVVDLINSFCLPGGGESVMDPACGGGTFLVRAYARKKALQPGLRHRELLAQIFGADIDLFAVNLTTINLATRDLVDEENYPQIARNDFFDVAPSQSFLSLPKAVKTKGLGKLQHREVIIPPLDAVVGNPPYIRQETIDKSKKAQYLEMAKRERQAMLSGRSDIHCFFWPHAVSFLKDDGMIGFVTSSQWLDVEYGFHLQEWILRNFEIVAILESVDEPWFVGARVATTVTILRRQAHQKKRMNNIVRFVQLRRPLKEILAHDGTSAGAMAAADRFRDEIVGLRENRANGRYRARLVRQGELWDQGVRLGVIMAKSPDEGDDDPETQNGHYYGGKWGVYLRAPDLWFDLLDRYGKAFAPLGDIAEIRFGVKSGKDNFFFPRDASRQCLDQDPDEADFRALYGVSRKEVESGRVKLVRCGEERGEIRPVESEYLEPEVHSLMEIDSFTVKPENCKRLILLVGKKKKQLKGTHVLRYIEWGESQGWHEGATCASRVTPDRGWYDLTGHKRGELFWSKSQQYKHAVPVNDRKIQCNCNLYDVHLKGNIGISAYGGILNSVLAILSKFQFGRPIGVEGNLKTEIVDVNMMLVPDPRKAASRVLAKISSAFEKMSKREVKQLISERRLRRMSYEFSGRESELAGLSDLSELDMVDRRELDDAVLEMIGVKPAAKRKAMLDELYAYLKEFFELTRQKEEKAIVNKKLASRKGHAKPAEIARQILDEMVDANSHLLARYEPDFIDLSQPFDTYEIPEEGGPRQVPPIVADCGLEFVKGRKQFSVIKSRNAAQDELLLLLWKAGHRGLVRTPLQPKECQALGERYAKFLKQRDAHLRLLVEERVADQEQRDKILSALLLMISK